MANTFVWFLAIATLVTGILWCLDRFWLAPARRARVEKAQQQSEGKLDDETLQKLAKQPGWLETCVSIFPVLAIVFMVRSFGYEPFQIPSGSMMPTLLVGDFILVEKYAYGVKNPLTQNTLFEVGHPKRGDIAVFKYPLEPRLDYIKRVIGLPGDRVLYDPGTKQVTVYPGCQQGQSCNNALPVSYSAGEPSEFVRMNPSSTHKEGLYPVPVEEQQVDGLRLEQFTENLDGVSHKILTNPGEYSGFGYKQPGQMLGVFVVPDGYYFMLGDNRDNSADSRFWGFVPEKNLVGKATFIWMSFEKQENEWPTGVRFNRIGAIH